MGSSGRRSGFMRLSGTDAVGSDAVGSDAVGAGALLTMQKSTITKADFSACSRPAKAACRTYGARETLCARDVC